MHGPCEGGREPRSSVVEAMEVKMGANKIKGGRSWGGLNRLASGKVSH